MPVLSTTCELETVAQRIERAYLRRLREWHGYRTEPRVWESAASLLLEAPRIESRAPIDPEMFVACQPETGTWSDPWEDLTRPESLRRYLRQIRRIIVTLRRELRGELKRIRRAVRRGVLLETLVHEPCEDASPLAHYIAFVRAGRLELAQAVKTWALRQHEACPLYRHAAEALLSTPSYPVHEHVLSHRETLRMAFELHHYWN
jgi:hypothetical protein